MERIQGYIKKHPFPSYSFCKDKLQKYHSNPNNVFGKYQYIVAKKIYENTGKEVEILRYAQILYDSGGDNMLYTNCLLLSIVYGNIRHRYLQDYGRKLEFLYQNVSPTWQA